MTTRKHIAALAICLIATACTGEAPSPEAHATAASAPQRAGQPVDPLKTAGHIAAARVAAITGDQDGVRQNMEAMTEDIRLAMKLPDAGRPIEPESARAAIRGMRGVRSVAWLDRSNLLVRVTGAEFRDYRFIDAVCQRLEPLGDTLAVTVHLRNANPRTRDDADSLGRNCQLTPVALLQREREDRLARSGGAGAVPDGYGAWAGARRAAAGGGGPGGVGGDTGDVRDVLPTSPSIRVTE